jgi:tetratricopeptide (TPR) repeat protein
LAIDKATILKNAQLFTSRSQYDKAIAEWTKLLLGTSADGGVFNTIGDLHLKRNASTEAVEAYIQAAAGFKAAGDPLKAIAVYRKILKVDPSRYKVYQQLGDLNAERGLTSSAITEYTTLCKIYVKEGRLRDAVEVYRTMARVEPSNLDVKKRLAELSLQEGLKADAIEAYLDLGRECHAQQRRDEARAAFEAALKIEPGNRKAEELILALDKPAPEPESETPAASPTLKTGEGAVRQASLEAAAQQIQGGEYAEGEAALMEMLSREPGDPEVCRLLARLHLKRGELSVAMGEFQFLAGAAMRAEDYVLAESMLMEYLAVEPRCALLIEALGQVYEQKGDSTGAAERYGQALTIMLEHPDPEQPTLAQDLFDKLKQLVPDSEMVVRYAEALKGGVAPPVVRDLDGLARAEAEQQHAGTEAPAPAESEHPASAQDAEPVAAAALQMDEQEAQARYELGVAYRNMGLFDEAMEELRRTSGVKELFLDSCCMMAECFKDQDQAQSAIALLEQALTAARDNDERSQEVRYNLGRLYEDEGVREKAVEMFSTISSFRDVPERLDKIKVGHGDSETGGDQEQDPVMSTAGPSSKSTGRTKKRRVSYL